ATARIGGSGGGEAITSHTGIPDASRIDAQLREELRQRFGFDKPWWERFGTMLVNFLRFDFGDSFLKDRPVIDLILEKLPVSVSLGVWSTLIIYLVSIPLGIRKAQQQGSPFDRWSTTAVVIGYAVPGYLFAVLLIILFAGGSYWSFFPLRGLTSPGAEELSWAGQVADYAWHLVLPITALVIGGFATLTLLTRNAFLEESAKQYVMLATAKGCTPRRILWGHIFRNAMLLVIAGFPATLIGMLFTGSVLIEVIFSLDGLGMLGFEAALNRDYPVVFATLYIFTLLGLVMGILTDVVYVLVDPRVDFEGRG
ncbi:MAG: ABC transporter permease subunit, partial [Holosporales bacterium]